MIKRLERFIKRNLLPIALVVSGFLFASWLMFSTLSYKSGSIYIATKAWSDFASHVPLIRSFSLGSNFPPQYPIFPGEPIHYHFVFYAFAGTLEKLGFRFDWALNLPSIIGFTALIFMIYLFAKKLFDSKYVGLLSVLFFIFNGSLSFVYFFKKYPLSINTLNQIVTSREFASFGPYDKGLVSAFWNLNIYTNQRHLAAAFALSLFLIYIYLFYLPLKKAKIKMLLSFLIGLTLGAFFFFHLVALLMTSMIIFIIGVLNKDVKNILIIFITGGILWIPQYLYLNHGSSAYSLMLVPGYLISDNLTFTNFVGYWIANLGLHTILIGVGLFFANKKQRIFFLAALSCFVVGNLFQFSPDMAGNHKFFNYFMLFGSMFTAFAIFKLWSIKKIPKAAIVILVFTLIFSGILDLFPIVNDNKISIQDYKTNKTAAWIVKNTPRDAVFFNTNFLYQNPSIAGRKIFLGWPYFAWSAGYDTTKRYNDMKNALLSNSSSVICTFMQKNNLSYLELTQPSSDFPFNPDLLKNVKPSYKALSETIYSKEDICNTDSQL